MSHWQCVFLIFFWNIRFGNNLCLFTKSHFFISSWKNLERHWEVMSIMFNHNLTWFSYFYLFIFKGSRCIFSMDKIYFQRRTQKDGFVSTLPSWPSGLRRRVKATYNSGMLLYEKIPRSNTHVNKRIYILRGTLVYVCTYNSLKWRVQENEIDGAKVHTWNVEYMTCGIEAI